MAIEPSSEKQAPQFNKQLFLERKAELKLMAPEFAKCLPPSISPDKFVRVCVTALQGNPGLLECDSRSFLSAALQCANDGLIPDGRLAAFVPFWDQDAKCKKAQYLPMIKGIIQRARELGDIKSITNRVVYENNHFEFTSGDNENIAHTQKLGDRGEIIGVYAIFKDQSGGVIHREVMSKAEVDYTRGFSKSKNSPAWRNWYSEMARKTVINRGSKYVPMSETLRQILDRENEFVDLNKNPTPDESPAGNPLIDTSAPVDDVAEVEQDKPTETTQEVADEVEEAPGADEPDPVEEFMDSKIAETGLMEMPEHLRRDKSDKKTDKSA